MYMKSFEEGKRFTYFSRRYRKSSNTTTEAHDTSKLNFKYESKSY